MSGKINQLTPKITGSTKLVNVATVTLNSNLKATLPLHGNTVPVQAWDEQ